MALQNWKLSTIVAAMLILGSLPLIASAAIVVNSDGTHVQSDPLASGVEYTIQVSGTFYFWLPNLNMMDASWVQPYPPNNPDWGYEVDRLYVNGSPVNS